MLPFNWNPYTAFITRAQFALDANTKKYAFSFILPVTKTINTVRFNYVKTGSAPYYKFGIQGDNNGAPDGTFIQSLTTASFYSGDSMDEYDIPDVTCTAGVKYWFVIEYQSGTVNSSNKINIYSYPGPDSRHPLTMLEAGLQEKTYNSGWSAVTANIPLFRFKMTDVTYFAQAFNWIFTNYTTDQFWYGAFITPTESFNLKTFTVKVAKVGSPATNCLYKVIRASDKAVLASGILGTPGQFSTSYQSFTVTLTPKILMPVGEKFYIVIYQNNSSTSNTYSHPYIGMWTASWAESSYMANDCGMVYTSNGGTSFIEDGTRDVWLDWTFDYPPPPIRFFANKNAVSGFHCFIEQAINNLRSAGSVIKNPNDNEFF